MMFNINELKIRASACHHLMGEAKGKSDKDLYYEAVREVAILKAKIDALKGVVKLTKTQLNQVEGYTKKIRECSQVIIDKESSKDTNSLPVTAQSYLRQLYKEKIYNRHKEWGNKYVSKGNMVEEDGITLLSLETGQMLRKNTERLTNEFLTGLPDLFLGATIVNCEEGKDIKCSWDVFTFPDRLDKELNKVYLWQNIAYMALTGAKKWTTSYCLVNAPGIMVQDQKYFLLRSLNNPEQGTKEYLEYQMKAIDVERNMIFDLDLFIKHNPGFEFESDLKEWREMGYDIPRNQRLKEYVVYRDETAIESLYQRVVDARIWIKNNLM